MCRHPSLPSSSQAPHWGAQSAEIAFAKAQTMLSQESGKDPTLEREIRQLFKDAAEIDMRWLGCFPG